MIKLSTDGWTNMPRLKFQRVGEATEKAPVPMFVSKYS